MADAPLQKTLEFEEGVAGILPCSQTCWHGMHPILDWFPLPKMVFHNQSTVVPVVLVRNANPACSPPN